RHHAIWRCAPARVQDHAARSITDRGPAHEREAGEQAGHALAGCRRARGAYPTPPTSALRDTRLLQWRTRQSVAGRARLDAERVRQTAASVATPARRMPRSNPAQIPAPLSVDVRYGRESDRRTRRPLRVLDIPATQKTPEIGRNPPEPQLAAPPL